MSIDLDEEIFNRRWYDPQGDNIFSRFMIYLEEWYRKKLGNSPTAAGIMINGLNTNKTPSKKRPPWMKLNKEWEDFDWYKEAGEMTPEEKKEYDEKVKQEERFEKDSQQIEFNILKNYLEPEGASAAPGSELSSIPTPSGVFRKEKIAPIKGKTPTEEEIKQFVKVYFKLIIVGQSWVKFHFKKKLSGVRWDIIFRSWIADSIEFLTKKAKEKIKELKEGDKKSDEGDKKSDKKSDEEGDKKEKAKKAKEGEDKKTKKKAKGGEKEANKETKPPDNDMLKQLSLKF